MIAIVLFTHADPLERADYAKKTLSALASYLEADEEFWLHIADDGSSQEFRDDIMKMARELYGNTSISNSEGRGYGASYNLATQSVHRIADLILPLEDDWEMCRSFNLDAFAKVLREGHFNCIRMGYIGYTDTLRATFKYYDGYHYLHLDPDSPEKHVFAGGPRLETVEFERSVEPWPEGLGAGHTELEVIGRPEVRQGIAWPIGHILPRGDVFLHIGTHKAVTGEVGSQSQMHQAVAQ